MVVSPSLLALDSSSQEDFGHFEKKNIEQLSSFELMFVAAQKLKKEGLKDKQVIGQAIPILQQLAPECKIDSVASPSGKLKGLTEHIAKEYTTL